MTDKSTIAAISTPMGTGGVGIIRISGENAFFVADKVFKAFSGCKIADSEGYKAHYGRIFDGEAPVDEAICLVFRAPHSYTGENVVEICCHGGLFVTKRLLRAVLNAGAVPAEPGEFTRRAFLNGRMDLAEAEAVMNVISAQGEQALAAAHATLSGSVSRAVARIADALTTAAAGLAVWTDYPDEDVPAVSEQNLLATLQTAQGELTDLIRRYDSGRAVTEGVSAVICGKPNVGKSTLMNLLTGRQRSIVTPIAGATRDIIEETVRVGDIVLRLADTAGLRVTEDAVEEIGVAMAREKMLSAALLLAVFDSSAPLDAEDYELLHACKNRTAVAIINKGDLEMKIDISEIEQYIPHLCTLSAKNEAAAQIFADLLAKALGTDGFDANGEVLAGERQRQCCEAAVGHLQQGIFALQNGETLDAVGVCIDCALSELFALTGKKVSEAVVSEVFSKFCVGK